VFDRSVTFGTQLTRDIAMAKGAPSRIATDVQLIGALIAGINKGEIKVPKFQRAFVWKDDQALNLLDSLANNYPVGSLLLWRTHEHERCRNVCCWHGGPYGGSVTIHAAPRKVSFVANGLQAYGFTN
jgi:hypothetical protein